MSKLPAAGRHQSMVQLITDTNGLSIAAIAEKFGVSQETVRRDLALLKQQGAVQRVYGGAMPADRSSPLEDRVNMTRGGKVAIGRLVAEMIEPNQWIFMTTGSSVLHVAQAMRNGPPVCVMTNFPAIGDALLAGPRHKVTFTGGQYNSSDKALEGVEVFDAIGRCTFDVVIIGVYGLVTDYGMVEDTSENMRLKSQLVEQSRRVICVGDHTKIGAPGRYQSVPFGKMDTFVTDEPVPDQLNHIFKEAGVKVILPDQDVDTAPADGASAQTERITEAMNG
ncbi:MULTISPECIES: DeoR/GlpR family DNA-binding transcription regulator [unclassified Mesorhizobium]|uniref:DeoR/GlpR family DNA-binding transcription regulator n=1 Tax=unclassified Mesorhizobium TaxID=325217 RepID=UPI000FE7BA3B|nr:MULTISPECIES: DeoR/GlpR family DNA-binding transcription regulator [unclassified Mesorhizobium]RWB93771.1 MAG: DeoR/GlpR transcriptional regulator [Mesorhizobium sp.]TGV18166.1 DeoR/GlpR transcriptional regulator [Mesorhizobium sp. M4B.F.Ca.ET.143.01.1.1]TIU21294.1 MAG: DeoR/GlpR transcriptional regulator [Mesorhizobium sp.]